MASYKNATRWRGCSCSLLLSFPSDLWRTIEWLQSGRRLLTAAAAEAEGTATAAELAASLSG